MMKRRLIAAVLSLGLTAYLPAQGAEAARSLGIDEAVRIALDNNLSLRRSALELDKKERASSRAWNSLIPSVSAAGLVSHPVSLTDTIPEERNLWTPGLQLSASLTLQAATVENIRAAKAAYEAGRLSYEQAERELEAQVRKLFYQIILLDAARDLAAQNLESARARYQQSAALARTGQAAHLDELSARVDMENQKPALRNAETAYSNAADSFKTLLGIPLETALTLRGTLDEALNGNPGADAPPPSGGGETLETAALLKSIETLEAQRNAARNGAYIPGLRLSWSGAPLYANEEWHDNSGSFSISLGINLDNFLPWSAAKTQIEDLNGSIGAARLQLDEARRNQESRIAGYRRTLEKTRETIEALKLNVELAQSAYALYEEAYRKGAADYQRLRDAGDSLSRAQNQVQQEQYNLVSALLDLEKELNLPFGSLR
jgi:outer membrane protein TolC